MSRLVFGRYRLVKRIGGGGMGEVFLATDLLHDEKVVVKISKSKPGGSSRDQRRMLSEATMLARLDHPGITKVYDCGIDEGEIYYVMEFIEGVSLAVSTGLTVHEKIEIFLDCAKIINQIHGCGIVHRDIKPENIIILPQKCVVSGTRAKIIDFGLSFFSGKSRLTETGHVVGTLNYMAPELLMGIDFDYRADLYSLGVTMFQSLTGRLPVETKKISSVAYNILNSMPEPPSRYNREIPHELDQITMSLLRRDPKERTQTAKELVNQLEEVIGKDGHSSYSTDSITVSIPDLFGREVEMERLMDKFEDSKSSSCSVVLLGPTGIGKSRLAEEFAIKAQLQGSIVLRVHGISSSMMEPLFGLRQLFWHLQFFSAFDRILKNSEEFISLASMNQAMMGKYKIRTISVKSGTRDRLESFKTIMAMLSENNRIIIVIDDYDQIDKETLDMCQSLVIDLQKNIMLLMTTDDQGAVDVENCLHQLNSSFKLTPIQDIGGFIKSSLNRGKIPESLEKSISNDTGGVPMLILDQLRSHVLSGSLKLSDENVMFSVENAKTIETSDYVAGILDMLTEKQRFVIDFAAVYGNRFTSMMISQVLGLSQWETNDIVDELVRLGMLSSRNETSNVYYWIPNRFEKQIARFIKKSDSCAFNLLLAKHLETTPNQKPHWIFRHYLKAEQEDKALYWAETVCWQMINDPEFNISPYLDFMKMTGSTQKDNVVLLKVAILEASLEARKGNIIKSLEMIDDCIYNAISSHNHELLAKSMKLKSSILSKSRLFSEAIAVEKNLLSHIPRICSDEDEYESCNNLSILSLYQRNFGDSLKYARQAHAIAKKLDTEKLSQATYRLVVRLTENQKFSEAYALAKEEIDSGKPESSNMMLIFPSILWFRGEIDLACTKISQIFEEITFSQLRPQTLANFVQILNSAGQTDACLELLEKVSGCGNQRINNTLLDIVGFEIKFGVSGWQNLLSKMEMAVNRSREEQNKENIIYSLLALGNTASHIPDLELSASSFRQAWELAVKLNQRIALSNSAYTIMTAINQPLQKNELKMIANTVSELPDHSEDKIFCMQRTTCSGMTALIDAKNPTQSKNGFRMLYQAKSMAISYGHKQAVGMLGKLLGKLHSQEFRFSSLEQDKEAALQNLFESEFIYRSTGANWLADYVSEMTSRIDRQ